MNKLVSLFFLVSVTLGLTSLPSTVTAQEQKITLNVRHVKLVTVLEEIQKQNGINFIYNEKIISEVNDITLDVKDAPIDTVMTRVLKGTNLQYEIHEKIIVITEKTVQKQVSRKISGVVRDEKGEPLPGVTVLIKGTTVGNATDIDGRFSINVPGGVTQLLFSFIGMETLEMDIPKDSQELNITMKTKSDELDEIVVTGFQVTTKRQATGSVAVVPMEVFANKANPSIDNLLQGQVAGVSVMAISGRPGETSRIRIRGTNTLSGDAEPLWVIDGVPMQWNFPTNKTSQIKTGDFNDIFVNGIGGVNPNDIENITILKDASATAIYGSRAAGGVIVVTTKKGKIGKMQVNYAANISVGLKPQHDPNLMNAPEKLAWEQELWDEFAAERFNSGEQRYPVVGIVGMLRAGKLGKNNKYWDEEGFEPMSKEEQDAYIAELGKHSTDWFNELFRNSVSTSHHLSLSGGAPKVAYYASLGYTKDNGLVKKTGYDRYTLNTKLSLTPSERLKMEIGLDLSQQKYKGYSGTVDLFRYAYFANPYESPYNEDGSYRADFTYGNLSKINGRDWNNLPPNGLNVLRELNETSSEANNFATTVRFNLEYTIIEGLKFNGLFSYGFANYKTDNINGPDTYAAYNDRLSFDQSKKDKTYGSIYQTSANNTNYSARGYLSYTARLGINHQLVAFGGAEIRGDLAKSIFEKRYGYDPVTGNSSIPLPSKPVTGDKIDYSQMEIFAQIVDGLSGQTEEENRFASFFASLDYNFKQKYVTSFSFRTDGSNNFGNDQQFNPTWSLGFAWHLGEENFMQSLRPIVSRMTLRVAGGYTGNISKTYSPRLIMSYDKEYRKYGNEMLRMGRVANAPNPNLRWEKTRDIKAALDFGLLDDRITGLVEGYYRKSKDVVTAVRVLSSTGFTQQGYNTSVIENKGLEATLNFLIMDTKDVKVRLSGNIAWNRNKVLDYKSPNGYVDGNLCEGFPLNSIFVGKVEEIDPETGLYIFKLRPDAIINKGSDLHDADNYLFYAGTKNAPYTGGFNLRCAYKNLSLSIGGTFVLDAKIREDLKSPASYQALTGSGESQQTYYNDLYRNHLNVKKDATNRWTKTNRTGVKYPRIIDYHGEPLNLNYYNVTDTEVTRGVYLENVAFARIRDITLGYTLPENVTRKLRISSLSFALTLNNFFTFTNYSGIDPETPTTTYPLTRSVTFGLNLGF